MKDIFKPYISKPQNAVYRPISEYVSAITRPQALADLDELKYLIDNRYSGKDYWQRNGIIFSECYDQIDKYICEQETVYISDFCRAIHKAFDIGIVDNHFSFASPLTGLLPFTKQYSAYFADLLVEKQDADHVVIESKSEVVSVGDHIDDIKVLFPTLAPVGKKRYLVGCRSYEPVENMTVTINSNPLQISVHRCRANTKTEMNDICLAHYQRNDIDILRSNCCDYVGQLTENTDYAAIGQRFSGNKMLILNYLSNGGGYNRITREFIQGLNGYVHCQEYSMKLVSPITEKHDCRREWVQLSESLPYDGQKGTYNGTLIMLVNSDTGSAGETAVLYGKSLRNFILIGENTMGCNTFGNVASYELTNSHIICRIPNVINLCEDPADCIEGGGFTPDYWVDSVDVESEVLRWIEDNVDQLW